MTSDGINRIATLFLDDIDKITFTQDNVTKEKTIFSSSVTDGSVTVLFKIDSSEAGVFDNFKMISKSGITYINKALSFQKENDEILIEFPLVFSVEEVI